MGDGPMSSVDRTLVWDESLATFVPLPPGNHEGVTVYGEQGAAFSQYSWENGWALLEGPSGSAGHAWNEPGFDGVAFRVLESDPLEIHIIDNKALSARTVSSATALDVNLLENLSRLESHVRGAHFDDVPRIAQVRVALSRALGHLRAGRPLPENVRLNITTFGGRSVRLSRRLFNLGIRMLRLETTQPQNSPNYARRRAPIGARSLRNRIQPHFDRIRSGFHEFGASLAFAIFEIACYYGMRRINQAVVQGEINEVWPVVVQELQGLDVRLIQRVIDAHRHAYAVVTLEATVHDYMDGDMGPIFHQIVRVSPFQLAEIVVKGGRIERFEETIRREMSIHIIKQSLTFSIPLTLE